MPRIARLSLVACVLALLTLAGAAGPALAQAPPPAGGGKYSFKNGSTWENPLVGFVCRGELDETGTIFQDHRNSTETLIIPAPTGYSVYVYTINTNEGTFGFVPDPTEPMEHHVAGDKGITEFRCGSKRNGVAYNPFFVAIWDANGNYVTSFFVQVGIGFVLDGNIPGEQIGGSFPFGLKVGAPNPLQGEASVVDRREGTYMETIPSWNDTDLLTGHRVRAAFVRVMNFKYDADVISKAMGDEVRASGGGHVSSTLGLTKVGTFQSTPAEIAVGFSSMKVAENPNQFPFTWPTRTFKWDWNSGAEMIFVNTWANDALAIEPAVRATAKNTATATIKVSVESSSFDIIGSFPFGP